MKFKIIIIIGILCSIAGCSGKTSEELYSEGLKEFHQGNPKGAIVFFKNALEKNQSNLDARYQLAKAYLASGKYEQAEVEFQKVRRQNPSLPAIKLDLAKTYNFLNKPVQAIEQAEQYMRTNPGSADAMETLGIAYIGRHMQEEGETFLLRALEKEPGRTSTRLELAGLYTRQGNLDKARVLLENIIREDRTNSKAYYMLADIEISLGNKEKALNLYKTVGSIHPTDRFAPYKAALIHLEKGETETAEKTAGELIAKFPQYAEGYRLKGLACFQRNNMSEAVSALQHSLKIQPNITGYYFLGLSLYNRGELENALSQFRIILDKAPNFANARLLSGMILLRQNRIDDSIIEIKRLLETDGNNALAHNLLGSAYMAKRMYEEGLNELNRATELNPGITDAYVKKGLFHLGQGKEQEGEADLMTAIKVAPEILNSRLLLASFYLHKANHGKAVSVLREGLRGNKSDAVIYSCMAKIMFIDQKPARAIELLQKAKERDPEAVDPYFTLAAYYSNIGADNKALHEYSAVLQKDPVNATAFIRLAEFMDQRGRDKEAMGYFLKAKAQNSPAAFTALAHYYEKKNDSKNAIAVLAEANSKFPRTAALLEMKGRLQMKEKQYKEALKTFDDLEEFASERGIALKISCYLEMKAPDKAIKEAKRVISLKPNMPIGYLLLAGIYRVQNNPDQAINELKNAIRVDGANYQAAVNLAELYCKTENYPLAMKTCEDILRKQPDFAPAYFTQGVLFEAVGQKKEAVQKYLKVLAFAGNHMPALNNLAILYAEGYGSKVKALELAKAALALGPENSAVMDTMGYVLYRNGRMREAQEFLEKAARSLPDSPTINYHLALVYKDSGESKRAVALLQKALRSHDFAEVRQAQSLLSELN